MGSQEPRGRPGGLTDCTGKFAAGLGSGRLAGSSGLRSATAIGPLTGAGGEVGPQLQD